MLINIMIETRLNNNSYLKKENPNSGLKVIILPLIGFILLIAITAALLFGQISGNQESLLNWVNISIIVISLLLFIPGLFLLIVILGLFMILFNNCFKLPCVNFYISFLGIISIRNIKKDF